MYFLSIRFGFYPRSGFIHVDLGPARQWGERFPIRATAFAAETPPAREVLADSRTMKGGGAAGVATLGAAGVEVAQSVLAETQSAILPLVPYLDTLRWVFIAVALGGIAITIYARLDDWKRPVRQSDIIVVAPYNAKVNALRDALPVGIRVGTVDKFQGQEAPICLVSMTASSAEETPRGMDFLFSLNRINVAVSRAKGLALVFGAPRLREVKCETVEQMRLVNTLCALPVSAAKRMQAASFPSRHSSTG